MLIPSFLLLSSFFRFSFVQSEVDSSFFLISLFLLLSFFLSFLIFFFPSFFLSSFVPSFLYSFLSPIYLSILIFFLPSFFASFLPSFLSSILTSFTCVLLRRCLNSPSLLHSFLRKPSIFFFYYCYYLLRQPPSATNPSNASKHPYCALLGARVIAAAGDRRHRDMIQASVAMRRKRRRWRRRFLHTGVLFGCRIKRLEKGRFQEEEGKNEEDEYEEEWS